MSLVENSARGILLKFIEAYLMERNLRQILSCLASQVQWIGTGSSELAHDRASVEQLLVADIAAAPDGYKYVCDSIYEQPLYSGSVMMLVTLRIFQGPVCMNTRLSALCIQEDGLWKISSIHASAANELQDEGEFFPSESSGSDQGAFERVVSAKTLDLLERNIPGGILGGYMEPGFPVYFVNSRILDFLGYTREEFLKATGGLITNLIYHEDVDGAVAQVMRAYETNQEYHIQYRVVKSDGSLLWVNDTGKLAMSDDRRTVCISVLRDITDEVEGHRLLEQEAAEKARQARRYNELFQSVLCGIIQLRLDPEGKVVFENANREAIRIFGYEPEEFWLKTDWDLPSLIAEEDRERVLNEVSQMKTMGDKSPFEYRVRQRDGSSCWIIGSAEIILNADGQRVMQSVFLDINTRKLAEQRSRLLAEQVEASNELLRLALEHTTTCECYYYPRRGLLLMPQRAQDYYGAKPQYESMPESFANHRVAEEYRHSFCQAMEKIDRGERNVSLEFPVQGSDLWCRATFSVLQYAMDGQSELAIGVLEDITREKSMEQALEDAHSKDSLTGLYNRESGVRLVQEQLLRRPSTECDAMMLLDMDNFELINAREGSAFADALLQEVADLLVSEAGEDGICVRLGGDEFMLLIRNCNKDGASVIGPRIASRVRGLFDQPVKDMQISVSIGMCVTDVAEEYTALYRCAESTLKYVKEHRRGTAACYLDTSNELGVLLTQLYTDEHPVNAIDRTYARKEEDLVSFALELLGKSKNLDDAVFLLFARIGKSLGLDRVSIVDANLDYQSYVCSYQWARNRADLQLGQEYYVRPGDFEAMSKMYDGDGLCDRPLRSGFSHIASCLHGGIWNYGEFSGMMVFEVDIEDYPWSDYQRKLLKELVKIVPSFLMKAKADAISQAKTEFLSRMSHEIRTPMNAISGMTTIAKSVLDDKERAMDCLEKIEAANGYLLELINDILDMSRIESGKLELNREPMDLAEQLQSLRALMTPQAKEKGLELSFDNDYQSNRPLMGDGLRLSQVLINIVGNAIKFTNSGGSVLVRIEQLEAEPRASLRFSVKDTGIGIEPAAMKRIFNAFEQAGRDTASQHGGTGLGLSISSRLVQLMGGQLEVHSQVGRGSEFYFTLSFDYAPEEAPKAQPPAPAAAPETDFSNLRLLVAEDNELNREILKAILDMQGFQSLCVSDGAQALEEFTKREAGYFDAVLMDIRMPIMDGLEATRLIRTCGKADARTIPIIALTANAFDEDSRKSLESGMNGHLTKPLQMDQLLDLLSRCLNKS